VEFTEKLGDNRAKDGCDAVFHCIVNSPEAAVVWYKNNNQLKPSKKYEMRKEVIGDNNGARHTLIIHEVRPSDEGRITATAQLKEHGEDSTSANLEYSQEGKFLFTNHRQTSVTFLQLL